MNGQTTMDRNLRNPIDAAPVLRLAGLLLSLLLSSLHGVAAAGVTSA